MKDIFLGAILLLSAVLMFVGAVLEWSALALVACGAAFVVIALLWLVLSDSDRPRV